MGSLSNFLGEPKIVSINGNDITIQPLKVKDMKLFSNQDATEEQQLKMTNDILKLSIPDSTAEEIDELPIEVFTQLMEEINKLNGFTDERAEKLKQVTSSK